MTLTADFQTSAYDGSFIDAVQWVISDPNVSPTSVSLDSFTVGGIPVTGVWNTPTVDSSLNANGCGGNAADAVCVDTVASTGYLVSGDTMVWTFTANFASTLTGPLTSGNIRAAFNKPGGKNLNIFSPDGGNFGTTTEGGGPTDIVPEPGLLLLFGSGLTMAATRLRRRRNSSASES